MDLHHHKINLGECETEEEILDTIEQSRKITRLIVSAVQKGSKFEVSQILEHYGLPMTSRLHFKVVSVLMEQWFSLVGIEDEEQIFNLLKKNRFAMDKLKNSVSKGTIVISDLLSEWELPIGALQSKIIRRIQEYFKEEVTKGESKTQAESGAAQTYTDNKAPPNAATDEKDSK